MILYVFFIHWLTLFWHFLVIQLYFNNLFLRYIQVKEIKNHGFSIDRVIALYWLKQITVCFRVFYQDVLV